MSWGKGITLGLAAFMSMIIYLVYQSTQQDFHLVSENYYEESLEHDAIQLKRSNYKKLGQDTKITINPEKLMTIVLPDTFSSSPVKGTVTLYKPTDSNKDVTYPFSSTLIQLPTNELVSGLWHVKVEWQSKQKEYLFESSSFISN